MDPVLLGLHNNKNDISFSKDIVSSLGCLTRKVENSNSDDSIQHAPFTLLPSPFSKKCFEEALDIQVEIHLILHKIAHNHTFLWECLKSVIKVDEYTRKLWEIYDVVYKEGYQQSICLGMIRSDYMLHVMDSEQSGINNQYMTVPSNISLKQVEMNTISSSFGGLSQQLHQYHRHITGKRLGVQSIEKVPVNNSCDCLAEGLMTSWKSYGNEKAVVLFLIYELERNIYDQRHLEAAVMRLEPRIKIIRRSISYMQDHVKLDSDRKLWIDEDEIAVVYQRCLYDPKDFVSEETWKCRLTMERSRSILCPNVGYHLAGTKKVQQVLTKPGVLEKFVEDEKLLEKIHKTFMRMYSLEKEDGGDNAIDEAVNNSDKFVLKPQREGGGNNIYGHNVALKLESIKNQDKRVSYILMERINPMVIHNIPIRPNLSDEPRVEAMVSELGVFGVLVGSKDNIILNKQGGYLLRTKSVGTDEGGVATGYSVLDSPYLIG